MQAVSDSNVLALSSSVAAMAGDVAMGVTQILSTSAQVASAAGPVGYAMGLMHNYVIQCMRVRLGGIAK